MRLAEKLDRIREGASKQIPPDILAEMHRATQELQDSGIVDGAATIGSRLPEFELENQNGDTVRSADLLATGPLVLSIFRGSW